MKKDYFVLIVLLFTVVSFAQKEKTKSDKDQGEVRSESFYAANPKLKYTADYVSYLFKCYAEDPKKTEPLLIECANKLIAKGDEKSFDLAAGIYGRLKMKDDKKTTINLAIAKYPKGLAAKEKFGDEFSEKWEKEGFPVESVIKFVADYKGNYTNGVNKDLDERMLNSSYIQILMCYVRASDTTKLKAYEKLHTNKIELSNFYNKLARNLGGKELSSAPQDLNYALYLSKKSIAIINEKVKSLKKGQDQGDFEKLQTYNFATLAMIEFKQGKSRQALDLMNIIIAKRSLNAKEKECYAAYLEKGQSLEGARAYLEAELSAGIDSKVMMKQLEDIYKKLNISENKFAIVKSDTEKLVSENAKIDFAKKYGDFKGIDFALTNMEGKKVQLSELKGKVVILDFWATWCGPCRASFPFMQKMVEKYKGKPVEFLFINSGENTTLEETVKIATKFITEEKYNFNVLFDFDKEVSKKYKINAIPAKVVIGKDGNLLSDSISESNIELLIDEQIR